MKTCHNLSKSKITGLLHRCLCAECRAAHRAADPFIARAVRQMTQTNVPPDGMAQTLATLHTLAQDRTIAPSRPRRQKGRILRLVGGAASLTAALVLLILILPLMSARKSLAAEVQAALSAVNTWHLSGWKMVEGRQVPWEVWGRRTPFFYREQVGSQIVWDDGKERYQIFAPDASLGRPTGLMLKTPSLPEENSRGWTWIHSFATWSRNSKPWKETQDQILFMNHDYGMQGAPDTLTDNLYTIDKNTMLLTQVTIQHGKLNNPARTTAEYLQATYDLPIPPSITHLELPEGITTLDTISTRGTGNRPRENTVTQNGLTVQATPLAVDRHGYVLIRLRAWLGDTELKQDGKPFVWGASAIRSEGVPAVDLPACYDESGHAYLDINSMLDLVDHEPGKLLLMAPLEPLPDEGSAPRTLTLALRVNPSMITRVSAHEVGSKSLMTEKVYFNLSLPLPLPRIAIEKYRYLGGNRGSQYMSLPSAASVLAYERANFYRDHYGFEGRAESKRKTSRSYWKASQAARWFEQAVALAPAHSNIAQFFRLDLANNYGWLGDTARQEAILREVIEESRRYPGLEPDYRRMAEQRLRYKRSNAPRK